MRYLATKPFQSIDLPFVVFYIDHVASKKLDRNMGQYIGWKNVSKKGVSV
jgi:hypothetical protein